MKLAHRIASNFARGYSKKKQKIEMDDNYTILRNVHELYLVYVSRLIPNRLSLFVAVIHIPE